MKQKMKYIIFISILFLTSFLYAGTQITINDFIGLWHIENNASIIQIYKAKNGNYEGKLVWVDQEIHNKDKSLTDIKNPNPELRSQKLIGLIIAKDFTPSGNELTGGTIYDPHTGKTYNAEMWFNNNTTTLNLRGYVGIPLFGETRKWTRCTSIPKD